MTVYMDTHWRWTTLHVIWQLLLVMLLNWRLTFNVCCWQNMQTSLTDRRTLTHTWPIALPGPLKWSAKLVLKIKNFKFYPYALQCDCELWSSNPYAVSQHGRTMHALLRHYQSLIPVGLCLSVSIFANVPPSIMTAPVASDSSSGMHRSLSTITPQLEDRRGLRDVVL